MPQIGAWLGLLMVPNKFQIVKFAKIFGQYWEISKNYLINTYEKISSNKLAKLKIFK